MQIDITTPRIGMGCWAIGGDMWSDDGIACGYGQTDDAVSRAALSAAHDRGVRIFDTAAAYGAGHSETLLGEVFGNRDDVIIVTKFGIGIRPRDRVLTGPRTDPGTVAGQVHDSLRRLRRDRIDLLFLHLNALPVAEAAPLFDALRPLQAAGKIGQVGWSTDFPASVAAMADHPGFAAVQHAGNLFLDTPSMTGTVEDRGLWALIRSPLAMGVLTGKFDARTQIGRGDVRGSGHSWLSYFEDGKLAPGPAAQLAAVRDLLQTGGRSLTQGALCWLLARSPRNIPIPGARNIAQVTENTGALDHGPLPEAIMAEIERILDRPPEGPPQER